MRKTREDTKYFMRTYHSGNFCEDAQVMLKEDAEDLVDEMYDDFESRTCGNCKHASMKEIAIWCSLGVTSLPMGVNKTFGCNKWEEEVK